MAELLIFLSGFAAGGMLVVFINWRAIEDCHKCYEAADARWHEGTAEYQKAVRALETARLEVKDRADKVNRSWEEAFKAMEAFLPPECVTEVRNAVMGVK